MLDLEADLHPEGGILFDRERLLFERLELAGLADVDDYIRATLNLQKWQG